MENEKKMPDGETTNGEPTDSAPVNGEPAGGEKRKPVEYDAFLSYRHSDFDTDITLTLHKQLESFKIKRGKEQRRIRRVFLDREELASAGSLSDSVVEALDNSRHLIVICSKNTPESPWVKKEIEYFVAKHGYDKVLALLIDGEPEEAFPEPLRRAEIDGVLREIEPLAADIRAENPKQSKKALKQEILRLVAPLLGMTYDEIRQRHQKMMIRRIIRTASLVAAFFLVFAAYAFVQWQHSEAQNRRILMLQSGYMAREALSLFEYGDKRLATFVAASALPSNIYMPERPWNFEAQHALTKILGVYTYPDGSFYSNSVFKYDAQVLRFATDPEAEYIAALTTETLSLRRAEDGMIVWEIRAPAATDMYENSEHLIRFYYSYDDDVIYTNVVDADRKLTAIDANTGKTLWQSDITGFALSGDGSFGVGREWGWNEVLDSWGNFTVRVNISNGQIAMDYFEIDKIFPSALAPNISVSPGGGYIAVEDGGVVAVADAASGDIIFHSDFEKRCYVYLSEQIAVVVTVEHSEDYFSTEMVYTFFDLPSGNEIDRFVATEFYNTFYFVGDSRALIGGAHDVMFFDNFLIYDYVEKEVVAERGELRAALDGVRSSAVDEWRLYALLGSGAVQVYNLESATRVEGLEFNFPADALDIFMSADGTFLGRAGNEIHVRQRFHQPGFVDLERDIRHAFFLDEETLVTSRWLHDTVTDSAVYNIDLWKLPEKLSKGETQDAEARIISSVERLPYFDDLIFDEENKKLYCVAEGTLYTIAINGDELVLESTFEAGDLGKFTLTDEGTPVLYGLWRAVINPGYSDSIEIETTGLTMLTGVYEKDGAMIFISRDGGELALSMQVEVFEDWRDREKGSKLAKMPTSGVYEMNPAQAEYVYADGGGLVFKGLFDESERSIDLPALGRVAGLFYSPDGSLLFISTEMRRLYALDLSSSSKAPIEIEADYGGAITGVTYIGDTPVIVAETNAVLIDPETLAPVGETDILRGHTDEKLVISNGLNCGVVPFYSNAELLAFARDVLSGWVFDEREIAKYVG